MRQATKKNIRNRRRVNVSPDATLSQRPIFSNKERLIYQFSECGKLRAVDPIRVASELAASDPPVDHLVKLMVLPTPDAGSHIVMLAAIIRKAFGCAEQREENGQIIGMTDGDCIALFNDFVLWVEEIKKKFGISSPFVMPSAPAGSQEAENSPTPTMQESISTKTEFSFADPSQSQSPLPSVSEKPQPGFMTL